MVSQNLYQYPAILVPGDSNPSVRKEAAMIAVLNNIVLIFL